VGDPRAQCGPALVPASDGVSASPLDPFGESDLVAHGGHPLLGVGVAVEVVREHFRLQSCRGVVIQATHETGRGGHDGDGRNASALEVKLSGLRAHSNVYGVGMDDYSIDEAATRTGLTKHTLRYYEREGLLPPIAKATSGHRR
jgi:hypothetical protein